MQNLSRSELAAEWQKCFKKDPPPRVRREFLIKHLEWQRQAKLEVFSARTRNILNHLMQDLRDGKELAPPNNLNIKSGTKLLREYRGVKHEVIILEGKYLYQGQQYRSLSQIARHITGTQWNGKLFFGVKS